MGNRKTLILTSWAAKVAQHKQTKTEMNNVLNHIAKDIQNKMTRFGIVAEFHPEEAFDYANRPYIKMVSSDFIIQPMIFKDIHCEGEVYITKHGDNKEFTDIHINIELRYNHWDGGRNGFEYAKFKYFLDTDDYEAGNPCYLTSEYKLF